MTAVDPTLPGPRAGAPIAATTAQPASPSAPYIGLATRLIAFALDAAIINVVALTVSAGLALIVTVLHLPHDLKRVLVALDAAGYILWSIGYFVSFWSTTGQTPGARFMRFRVIPAQGAKLPARRAFVRTIGLVLSALPLFAGYILILFDRKRRGLLDLLARTVVVEAPQLSIAEQRREQRRAVKALGSAAAPSSSKSGDERPSV